MTKNKAKLIYQYINDKYKEFNDFQNIESISEFIRNNQVALTEFYNLLSEEASYKKHHITGMEDYEESDSYYIDQFNIGGRPLFKDRLLSYENFSKSQDEKLLDNVAFTTRQMLCNYLYTPVNIGIEYDTRQCCGIATYLTDKIVKDMEDIESKKIIISDLLGTIYNPHACSLITINDTNYIMDVTFSQFISLYYMSLNCLQLPKFINAKPGFFMFFTQDKECLLKQLLQRGWFEATEQNLKFYFDSFILSDRNAYYYLENNTSMFETEFTGNEYLTLINGNSHNILLKHNYSTESDNVILTSEQNKIITKKINEYKTLKNQ